MSHISLEASRQSCRWFQLFFFLRFSLDLRPQFIYALELLFISGYLIFLFNDLDCQLRAGYLDLIFRLLGLVSNFVYRESTKHDHGVLSFRL